MEEINRLRIVIGGKILADWNVQVWAASSRKGDVCGIWMCDERPVIKCTHCGNWYCEEHRGVLQTPGHPIKYSPKKGRGV